MGLPMVKEVLSCIPLDSSESKGQAGREKNIAVTID